MPADTTLMLKVMTYNVLGFNYQDPELCAKPSATMKLILDADPDVVLLQEGTARDLDWSQVPSLKPYIGEIKTRYPYCYHSSEGLSIMSKFPFTTGPWVSHSSHVRPWATTASNRPIWPGPMTCNCLTASS